jgi:hypothetical protein
MDLTNQMPPAECPPGARSVRSGWLYLPPGAQAIEATAALGCRWPVGEVDEPDFHFCGAPRRSGSYCPTHLSLSRKRMAQ